MPPVSRELELTYGSVAVASVQAANGIYVLEADQPQQWITVGTVLRIYGATNAANSGTFTVTAVVGLNITTTNSASVLEPASPARIGFPVAGTSGRILDSQLRYRIEKDTFGVEFSFTIRSAIEADFVAEVLRVERAFRVPYQRLEIRQGASQPALLDPLDSSGFNARPSIEKREEIAVNTGRSRRYHIAIEFDLPADLYVQSGRRNATAAVDHTPNDRRTVVVAGEWTATPTHPSARAAYLAGIDGFASSVFAAVGGTYDKAGETVEESPDQEDKLLRFSRSYREILDEQSGGPLDDPDIFDPTLEVSRLEPAPGDSMPSRRLGEIGVAFTAWIKKGVGPRSKYNGSLRSFLINKALALFDASGGALVAETVNEDPHNNRLLVNLQILAQIENVSRISFRATSETDEQTGAVLVPAWTGDPLAYHLFQGHAISLRIETEEERVLTAAGAGTGIGGTPESGALVGAFFTTAEGQTFGGGMVNPGGGGGLPGAVFILPEIGVAVGPQTQQAPPSEVLLSEHLSVTPIRLGTPEHHLDAQDRTRKRIFQRFHPISAAVGVPSPGAQGAMQATG